MRDTKVRFEGVGPILAWRVVGMQHSTREELQIVHRVGHRSSNGSLENTRCHSSRTVVGKLMKPTLEVPRARHEGEDGGGRNRRVLPCAGFSAHVNVFCMSSHVETSLFPES